MRKLFFIILSVIAVFTINHLDAHADILYFKDGTKKHVGRTWKEDGHVKWKTWGITVWYTEEELERVGKSPYEDYGIGTRPIANEKIKKEIKSPVQTFSQSELQSKGFRMADGIVLKGVSKSSQSVRLVVEASKKRMVKCEAYDSNDNLIGTSTSLVKQPLHEITIKTNNKTGSVKTVECWPTKDQILKATLQDQSKKSTGLNPIAKVPRSKAKSDIKRKLAQTYDGSYSTQKMLLDHNMESYDYLISLPSNAVNNQILSKLKGSYYPNFSTIKMLYEHNIKSYRELNQARKPTIQKQDKASKTPISSQSIKEEIADFAKRQYPHDSKMQKYVYQKQTSAYNYMLTVNDSDVKEIATNSYPDDYSMQKHVYGKQLSAKHYMKIAENEEIKRFALKSYSHDYSMQQYVYNKQLAAKQYMETVSNSAAKSKAQRSYPYDYSMQKYVYDKIVY